jgi:hypothetical protein
MEHKTVLVMLCLLAFYSLPSTFAQSQKPKNVESGNIVITMKQELKGIHNVSPYLVTIFENGTITYEGIEEYIYDRKQKKQIPIKEIPVKIVKNHTISKKQFKELVNEFYKIDFFSLNNKYITSEDGLYIFHAAPVTTSITINGKTKSVYNWFSAPNKLIELQRKIYEVSNIASYTRRTPYWLSKFPN